MIFDPPCLAIRTALSTLVPVAVEQTPTNKQTNVSGRHPGDF